MLQKITFRAEKALIEQARQLAKTKNTTLNAEFRRWLAHYVQQSHTTPDLTALMSQLSYAQPGKTFTRNEMDEQ